MKKLIIFILFAFVSIQFNLNSQTKGIPYTLEDRDRLIRVEAEQKALRNEMNARFELIDKRFEQLDKRMEQFNFRFDDQKSFLTIITSIFTVLTLSVIGFAWWDRRTTIGKAKEETISVMKAKVR